MLNALLVAGAGALALVLWRYGKVEVGAIAMVLPLTYQLTSMSRWIAFSITDIFEEIGVVQEGMLTIAQPLQLVDRADARAARRARPARSNSRTCASATTGARERGVLDGFTLKVAPGREDRAGRPLRRRQVHRGQPAAALLRPRRRPHPDRRPGHLAHDAGVAARADFDGDAGHLAAAPLDPRQHPLRHARARPTRR